MMTNTNNHLAPIWATFNHYRATLPNTAALAATYNHYVGANWRLNGLYQEWALTYGGGRP